MNFIMNNKMFNHPALAIKDKNYHDTYKVI